jgi:ubiquinone/menaquinone biosynthesis C-methylase UbiE
MKVLKIACGTGRFMTSIQDDLPLHIEWTVVDLSAYYLDATHDNGTHRRKIVVEKRIPMSIVLVKKISNHCG